MWGRGNMCKAADDMRPGESKIVYSEVEKAVIEMEKSLGIADIDFERFERSIKRFGYCIDLTDDCWKVIASETRVDVAKFQEED